jgi:nucleoside-diphosphate-sugar epimerase
VDGGAPIAIIGAALALAAEDALRWGRALELEGKRLVVIGGAGLIGSHTVEQLTREDVKEIVVFDNFVRGTRQNLVLALSDPRVRIFDVGGDITQPDILEAALEGADGVFHFAALWLLQCWDYPRAAFKVNIEGTFNVLEACVKKGVSRLVYSSSASVYGDAVEEPMTEDHPFMNTNFYGATKVAGEQMARAFHHRYGLNYAGLRYMNVYGPRQDYQGAYIAVIMKMLDNLDKGVAPRVFGDGSQAYDFVYVGDCARANVCAMRADTTDRFYNVGTGRRTSVKELAEILLELTGSDLEIIYDPEGKTFVKNRVGSPERAKKEIGFAAETELREGLANLIEWRRDHIEEVERRRRAAPAG